MFWNILNLFLWNQTGNKQSSCSVDYKYREFIFGQPEKQFKIQSHFGIFDPVIGEVQWYDDSASQYLKCICELSRNIWLLYSMK